MVDFYVKLVYNKLKLRGHNGSLFRQQSNTY